MTQIVPFATSMPFQTTATAFAAGLLVPMLARRDVFSPALAPLALVGSLLTLPNFAILGGVAAVLFVGMAVQNGSQGKSESLPARAMTKLGDWSYALYLCHAPIQIWLYTVVTPRLELSSPVLLVLALVLPLLVSVPLGMFDVRLYRRLKQWVDTASVRRRIVCASAFVLFYVVASAGFILDEMF